MRKQSKPTKDAARETPLPRERKRLSREAAKLEPKFEQAMAEEGLSGDFEEWAEY